MSNTKEVRAPFDGALLGTVDLAGAPEVQHALATAHGLFRDRRRWLSVPQRLEILARAASLLEARVDEFALGAAREGGKPLADSRVEVRRAVDGLRSCVEVLRTDAGHAVPMDLNAASAGRTTFKLAEPIGVVSAVSAFNHPVNLIVHQVGPAIAAGCPFIVKPSADTPLSCFRVVALLHEAGLPQEWGQALLAERDVAELMVTDPRVAFLSFVGSARVGWSLRSKLAPGTRCALEHGGAAPVIVAADADLARALPALAKGGFYHAGQVCVSVQRVFAHSSIAEDVGRGLAALAAKLRVGDPAEAATEVGPLIRPGEVKRVGEWVGEAVTRGARLLSGGKPLPGNCYAPTVLYDPPDDCRVSREEVFGPVVCVYPYDDVDAAIARANALPWAFQAAVFTRDIDAAMHACRELDASAVMVNDHTAFRVDWMPFAGLRQSGLGVGGIPYTYGDMRIEKMCVVKS
ncbi:MAG TPA: aldehyde dehydrogenase family protein [Usitatibacter sp.]|nr:aldehyde dehydrogenase family protein [Usitatibacter sp.]